MKKLILVIILVVIIIFTIASYFFIARFSNPNAVPIPSPTSANSQTHLCQSNQLSTNISAQGAAGNIYATLEMTNSGKTTCEVVLGNTVTAMFTAKNIIMRYEQTVPSEHFMLAPNAKIYSQIHYPNGPQCQSGITQKPITFFYKTAETNVEFVPTMPVGKLVVQACLSEAEKTIIDIWPLSKTPITQ
jgi:hypothetical protein